MRQLETMDASCELPPRLVFNLVESTEKTVEQKKFNFVYPTIFKTFWKLKFDWPLEMLTRLVVASRSIQSGFQGFLCGFHAFPKLPCPASARSSRSHALFILRITFPIRARDLFQRCSTQLRHSNCRTAGIWKNPRMSQGRGSETAHWFCSQMLSVRKRYVKRLE